MADKRGDLSKIQGMGNGVTTQELQRRTILDTLAEELATKKPLLDGVLALIDEDEQKIAELERILESSDTSITITADVDEAVTGFKRLQRELRATTRETRELEQAYKDVEQSINLSDWCGNKVCYCGNKCGNNAEDVVYPELPNITDLGNGFVEIAYPEDVDLSEVSTKELHEELAKREGVEEYTVKPHGSTAKLSIDNETHGNTELIEGPARILVNKD